MNSAWSRPGYTELAALIEEQTGLSWSAARREGAEIGMRRAMDRARVTSITDYIRLVGEDTVARDDLIAELTIGETYFFRDPAQFALIREQIAPQLRPRSSDRPIRVWSAGCASGEEPYSTAIVLLEQGLGDRMTVVGTDIARHRLAAARRAHYTPWSLRGVPPATVARYFRQTGRRHVLDRRVRDAVEFRYLNLAEDHYPSLASGIWGMDLILCRNVLIYFDRDVVAHVASRLVAALADDGWLLLGAADPPIAEFTECEVHVTDAGIAYRRRAPASQPSQTAAAPRGTPKRPAPRDAPERPRGTPERPAPRDAPERRWPREQPSREPRIAAGAEKTAAAPSPAASRDPDASRDPYAARDAGRTALAAARAAYAARHYDEAADFAAAAAEEASQAEAWVLRVRALANLGRLVAASRVCLAGLERHATSAELAYLHAVLLAHAERPAEAAAAARQALYLDRTLIVAHIALADATGRLGDEAAVRRSLRNAERLLERVPAVAAVPAADGESAGRLLQLVRTRLGLLEVV